ncbi:NAD-dependent succinate-semialdehyde dehydrogenase [Ascidiimonas sp. W6]|uniref:NAD-dependent succinate-semialdehyde dehydrogenase n=1 Tax=Ascidiimonas meishanensis TaxID=3128903 RepID=UPI0030ED2F2F
MITTTNPYTSEKLKDYKTLSDAQIAHSIEQSHFAFLEWRKTSFAERAQKMKKLAGILQDNKKVYAATISLEMGKPITQAIAEIEKCSWVCEFYAEKAAVFLANESIETDASTSYIKFDPLGVILAVMPWNYPFWQVFRFAVPALMAGNAAILKHASSVMGSAIHIEQAFKDADFPSYTFQNMIVKSEKVEKIIKNKYVRAVTLTGSKSAGVAVASAAARQIKKSVLELGGSNAFIVSENANLDRAIEVAVDARFQNTGQSCIAAKRLLLHQNIAENFLTKFLIKIKQLKSGDPLKEETYIGVMAREDLAEELERILRDSIDMGAQLVLGGQRKGAYFEPTVVTNATMEMPVFKEETFGPVIGIATFKELSEAIEIVNTSDFGLGVTLFSEDKKEIEAAIPQFDDGAVFINEKVKSDPRLPFGGTKISGYGRELSYFGIREFVNIKTVYYHSD